MAQTCNEATENTPLNNLPLFALVSHRNTFVLINGRVEEEKAVLLKKGFGKFNIQYVQLSPLSCRNVTAVTGSAQTAASCSREKIF